MSDQTTALRPDYPDYIAPSWSSGVAHCERCAIDMTWTHVPIHLIENHGYTLLAAAAAAAAFAAAREEVIGECVSIVETQLRLWNSYGSATAGARASLLEDLLVDFHALLAPEVSS